ncbi:kinase-like protein [Saitoella complicata NRRL Y-17804]|uniref:Protein kinase domain-containing protein n=1 Tax=Saitoella complicata (strain BCRC 22490 / CBS 7301 / JCM 7358 / NBRC 10748 / NRRL Y-17804) TaxID=698492 RepID=A0A0E9NBV0_SAICN|nr:kinase-like protein [Saitoella complicata NRRL Y-17804]ODQ51607.1 kinase-like protein [Saitoella complicata NRRL Y-17804]GAO47357.1 hypothetical protein G7K_1565-t1 [Saitoella complicata NRRL Y-17804]
MAAVFAFDDSDDFLAAPRRDRADTLDSNDEHWVPGHAGVVPGPRTPTLSRESTVTISDSSTIIEYNAAAEDGVEDGDVTITHEGAANANFKMVDDDETPMPSGAQTPRAPRQPNSTPASPSTKEYEVPLDEDFVSSISAPPSRKMAPSDFTPLKVLGKGAYGTVHLVKQNSTGRLFAQKQLKKASIVVRAKTVDGIKAERQILEEVRHPFIVKLFYAFQSHTKLYLILEYAMGGELFTHLETAKMFDEATAAFYTAEIVLALSHLHSLGVVYRDLKPENCLLDAEGHVLLTDFGLSKVSDANGADEGQPRLTSFVGTCEYMAPEILQEQGHDAAVDWWSLGVLLYEFLTGMPPFTGNNKKKIMDKITKTKLSLPYYLSPDAKDLLTKLLKKTPSVRLGSKSGDVNKIKAHRLFRKIDWKALERREVSPPIVPMITDPELAENFADEFTTLAVVGSPPVTPGGEGMPMPFSGVDGMDGHAASSPGMFKDFSYIASTSFIQRAMEAQINHFGE